MNGNRRPTKDLCVKSKDWEALKAYRDAKSTAHEIAEADFKLLDRLITKIEKQNNEA